MPVDQEPSEFLDDAEGETLAGLSERGIGGVVLAISTAVVAVITGIVNVSLLPLEALGIGSADIVEVFTSVPAVNLGEVIGFSATSLTRGAWDFFGPFAALVFAAILLAMLWLLLEFLDRRNSDLPGTGINLPGIGNDSDGKED